MRIGDIATGIAQRLGVAKTAGATAGGALNGVGVQHAAAQAPAPPSAVKQAVQAFFEQTLPQAFARGTGAVMNLFAAPMDGARTTRIQNAVAANIDPAALAGSMRDVTFSNHSDPVVAQASVAQIFCRDVANGETIRFAGKAIDTKSAPGGFNADYTSTPRAHRFCQEMTAHGVSQADLTVLSRVINQSTGGCVVVELFATPLSVNGQTIHLQPTYPDRSWNIRPTAGGFDVVFQGSGQVNAAQSTSGDNIEFGHGSSTDLRMTLNLRRDANGELQLTGVGNASYKVNAFDKQGHRVS